MSTTIDRECAECNGPESKHDYSPPGYESSDGLPTFIACWCEGPTLIDDDDEFPVPYCKCEGFDPGDDE